MFSRTSSSISSACSRESIASTPWMLRAGGWVGQHDAIGTAKESHPAATRLKKDSLSLGRVGSACCYWNGCGTRCSHPVQRGLTEVTALQTSTAIWQRQRCTA